uniref:Solute carrier family 35 member B4 n=1 Tax=Phallusia mammillata TaxID=59560 RepID=A0A6F9DTD3_9ASCI|nr:UDP-xylose and UDP-N-acetylglucosamine transporter [Phallusia mammillata]
MFLPTPAIAVCTVMLGCGLNVVFLEHLIRASASSGNMIVFFQFLFVSVEGFIFQSKFGTTKRILPLSKYAVMVMMYFGVSVTNIMALNCNIPMPLHMIFKSGSLVANLLLGVLILKKNYPFTKFMAVFLVSLGILTCTFATSSRSEIESTSSFSNRDYSDSLIMLFGVFLLLVALFMSARLGIYQETVFKQHGKLSREALYYNHMLPLPFFVFLAPSIIENIAVLNQSESQIVPFLSSLVAFITGAEVTLPILWQYMIANLLTQYVCIRSIFYLVTVCTSLTVTLVITLRKFVSIIISVLYFNNAFTAMHWMGTSFVFVGTLLYANVFGFGTDPSPQVGDKEVSNGNVSPTHKKTN